MSGKTALVTGANSGIGYETALDLAKKGYTVFFMCRSLDKANEAIEKVKTATGNQNLHPIAGDAADLEKIRSAAKAVLEKTQKLDALINNAGVFMSDHKKAANNVEMVFAVNHLAPFLLTHLLMPALLKSDDARIVNVSSKNHFRKSSKLDLDDLSMDKGYSGLRSYDRSKLANILSTMEMDRQLKAAGIKNVSVNVLHPGRVQTDIAIKNANIFVRIFWIWRRKSGITPEQGAKTQLHLATSPEVKGKSGTYWDDSKEVAAAPIAHDKDLAKRLWDVSLKLCGINKFLP